MPGASLSLAERRRGACAGDVGGAPGAGRLGLRHAGRRRFPGEYRVPRGGLPGLQAPPEQFLPSFLAAAPFTHSWKTGKQAARSLFNLGRVCSSAVVNPSCTFRSPGELDADCFLERCRLCCGSLGHLEVEGSKSSAGVGAARWSWEGLQGKAKVASSPAPILRLGCACLSRGLKHRFGFSRAEKGPGSAPWMGSPRGPAGGGLGPHFESHGA